jgi:signal transduction histidine kinase/type II secretory pathway pseudopilin PulG
MERTTLLKNKRIRNILVLILIAFFVIIGLLTLLFYKYSLQTYETQELNRLQGIANAISLHVDGDKHKQLLDMYPLINNVKSNTQNETYLEIHRILKTHYDANMLKSPVYTLVKSGEKYVFGVTSQNEPYYRNPYESYHKIILDQYLTGGVIPAYSDEYGMWLSGFAPIKNKNGETVAILMVDSKLEEFMITIKKEVFNAIGIAVTLFTIMYFMLAYILGQILSRENEDKISLQQSNVEINKVKSELEITNAKLVDIDHLRKEMVANMAHDLRTPLSSIKGFLELIRYRKDLDENTKHEYVDIAHTEANRLTTMVNDLFELSNLESGVVPLKKEKFNMIDLVQDVSRKYQLHLNAKHVELSFDLSPNTPMVFGDIKYYERVVQNLVDNAVKYVFEGGFIKISTSYDDSTVKVKVCNLGEPISEDNQRLIFDRYFKQASQAGGTGLGLAISKRICELHDQMISIEVDKVKGINSFWFTAERIQ